MTGIEMMEIDPQGCRKVKKARVRRLMVRDVVVVTVVVAEAVVDEEVLGTVVTETQTDSLIEDLEITRVLLTKELRSVREEVLIAGATLLRNQRLLLSQDGVERRHQLLTLPLWRPVALTTYSPVDLIMLSPVDLTMLRLLL